MFFFSQSELSNFLVCLMVALKKVPSIVGRFHNYPTVVLPALQLLARSAKKLIVLVSVEPDYINE